jgi:hypothetical protein
MEPAGGAGERLDESSRQAAGASSGSSLVAEVLAALAYGELRGAKRSLESVSLARDAHSRTEQQHVADLELKNQELIEARLRELGEEELIDRFRPYFDAFFDHTQPRDWIEAQTFHYVGDALVADFADVLIPLLDRVSAEVVRRALREREDQETFALDELTRAIRDDPAVSERIRKFSQRIVGEAFTQTSRALGATEGLRALLGGEEAGKRFVIQMLDGHRQRLDRLGIEPVESD